MNLIVHDDPYKTLMNCGAIYTVPRHEDGRYAGPLVAFTSGIYGDGGKFLPHIGETYINSRQIIRHPIVGIYFASIMFDALVKANVLDTFTAFVGIPTCGIPFAYDLARLTGKEVVLARRDGKGFTIDQYVLKEHRNIWLVDDVVNAGSTALALFGELRNHTTSSIAGMSCYVNRSPHRGFSNTPLISCLDLPHTFRIYHQKDEQVRDEVENDNVEWNPKDNWDTLMRFMGKNQ